jgi:hypothetical protein
MPFVETQWWAIEIPDEWNAQYSEDCVTVSDCDGIGSIDISALKKQQGIINDEDLREFADDLLVKQLIPQLVEHNGLSGFYFEYLEDGLAWREWYLAVNELFIYITYNSESENKNFDVAVVDQILETLTLIDESETVQDNNTEAK